MKFVRALPVVNYKTIAENQFSLSAAQHRGFYIKNSNRKKVKEFLSRQLTSKDLGEEVGSLNYIESSPKIFLKTKALQPHSFIPDVTSESTENIRPSCFVDKHLSAGDIIISKDSNIGEAAILERDYVNTMLSGAIYQLPVAAHKYYLFAFLKHPLFKEQLYYMAPKGSVIRHCKSIFLECEIPFPNSESEETIKYVERIVKSIVQKERMLKERYNSIIHAISAELNAHQKDVDFAYKMPNYFEALELCRLDASIYSKDCKHLLFKIRNYTHGSKTISELGYKMSRGQNLQISNIGDSIYSDTYYNNFYTLILPKFLSAYGTAEKVQYLGNPHRLKTLKPGDLIFGAEGCGRSFVVVEELSRTITNIHGITIQHSAEDSLTDSIFVKCFLDYLRESGLIDMLSVGGNGGSLGQKYWGIIPFPNFPQPVRDEIAKYYHNADAIYNPRELTDENFASKNHTFDCSAGIYELDKAVKHLKSQLNTAIEKISNDERVERTY